jgi:ubiquinone/menaquinone biosynthesis C-methylase UbiE
VIRLSHKEAQAAMAFNMQAPSFDKMYGKDAIIKYKRQRVRDHFLNHLPAYSSILELNAGTGEDAVYFSQRGHKVHATDVSAGMQQVLLEKVDRLQLQNSITTELCSFTQLQELKQSGPFDAVFSNFAGLNCTGELDKVLESLDTLLNPGGIATLVLLPKFCLWESLLVFKGKFLTATRRWFNKNGIEAKLDDPRTGDSHHFKCWYYQPSFLISRMKNFELLCLEGLCTIVPPSYIKGFAEKYPRLFRYLQKKENGLKSSWPWKYWGDYYIITFRKK